MFADMVGYSALPGDVMSEKPSLSAELKRRNVYKFAAAK